MYIMNIQTAMFKGCTLTPLGLFMMVITRHCASTYMYVVMCMNQTGL